MLLLCMWFDIGTGYYRFLFLGEVAIKVSNRAYSDFLETKRSTQPPVGYRVSIEAGSIKSPFNSCGVRNVYDNLGFT